MKTIAKWALCAAVLCLNVAWAGAQAGLAREITFASDGETIPGTLLMPAGALPVEGVPVIVLVHGSGPNDRDESIGPNKVFADLANDLVAHGVATLRYDKRTYLWKTGKIKFLPGDDLKLTLATEVVDDAVAALAFASTQPGIDRRRIFVLGHSLGGTMAPRIAAERLKAAAGSVSGVIELAGAAVPPSALLPLQIAFQSVLRGKSLAEAETQADQASVMFRDAHNPSADLTKRVMFSSAAYLKEWDEVNAPRTLRALGLPVLVMRGQKDVQVTYQDYVLLAKAATFAGSKAVEFAGLNHLMMEVAEESTGDEYLRPGHVASVVADTIAKWIRSIGESGTTQKAESLRE